MDIYTMSLNKINVRGAVLVLIALAMAPLAASTPPQGGDWTVSGSEVLTGTCTVYGDVTVYGTLVLRNATLMLYSPSGPAQFRVMPGGTLVMDNSTVMGIYGAPYLFTAEKGSSLRVVSSVIKNAGTMESDSGFNVLTDNASITDTTVRDCFHGLVIQGNHTSVSGLRVISAGGIGLMVVNSTGVLVRDYSASDIGTGTPMLVVSSDADVAGVTGSEVGMYSSAVRMEDADVGTLVVQDGALNITDSSVATLQCEGASTDTASSHVGVFHSSGCSVEGWSTYVENFNVTEQSYASRTVAVFTNSQVGNVSFSGVVAPSEVSVYVDADVRVAYQSSGALVPGVQYWFTDVNGRVISSGVSEDGRIMEKLPVAHYTPGRAEVHVPYSLTVEYGKWHVVSDLNCSTVVLDDVAPSIVLSEDYNTTYSTETVQIQGETDAGVIFLNGVEHPVEGSAFSLPVRLTEGENSLNITACDVWSNCRTVWVYPVLDTTPPHLTVDAPASAYTNNPVFAVRGETDGTRVFVNSRVVPVADGAFSTAVLLHEGENQITVTASDSMGNQESIVLTVILDTQPPDLTLNTPSQGSVTNERNVLFSGSVGPDDVLYVDGRPVATYNGVFAFSLELEEGSNTVHLMAVDLAGNTVERYIEVYVDTVPPVLRVDSLPELLNVRDVVISGSTDGGAVYVNQLPASMVDGRFTVHYHAAEGTNRVHITAEDAAGNRAEAVVEFTVDTVPPEILLDPVPEKVSSDVVRIAGRVADASDVFVNGELLEVSGGYFEVLVHLSEGENTITISASDAAGNGAVCGVRVVLDTRTRLMVAESRWSGGVYIVRGTAEPGAVVTAGDQSTVASETGTFTLVLPPGEYTLSAADGLGNTAQVRLDLAPVPVARGADYTLYAAGIMAVVGLASVAGIERFRVLLLFLYVPLYRKFRKKNVLDHYIRGQIHGYIMANPGEHYNAIKDALGLNNGTLAHHLKVLERERIIKSRSDGLYRRFYPAGMHVPEEDQGRLTEVQKIILRYIEESPGVTQKELTKLVGLSPSTVNYHTKKMIQKGYIRAVRRGISVRYYSSGMEE